MKELKHLQEYTLTLSVCSPLFVGTGRKLTKNEYLYNSKNGVVSFVDEEAFLSMLIERHMENAYESFIMSDRTDLYDFLVKECHFNKKNDLFKIAPRFLRAGSAMGANDNRTDLYLFQRDSSGRAYIPGSSLKGALRTIWLAARILEEDEPRQGFTSPSGQRINKFRPLNPVREEDYVNQLQYNEKRQSDAVNSIFRGVSISDSEVIPDDQFVLCRKTDVNTNGGDHDINLIRECVKPGAKIRFRLTLDQFVLNGRITPESLMNDIATFVEFYREHYISLFSLPQRAVDVLTPQCIFLGGGAGFFTKSLEYEYWGDERALEDVAALLHASFDGRKQDHRHDRDTELGVSPHTLKYTDYQNKLYPFGICRVTIQ